MIMPISTWKCIHRLGKINGKAILPVTNWGPKSPYSTASMILVAAWAGGDILPGMEKLVPKMAIAQCYMT